MLNQIISERFILVAYIINIFFIYNFVTLSTFLHVLHHSIDNKKTSIFKNDNCRRLPSCGFFKYKNDSFQSSNVLLLFFIDFGQW